jgi:hypothetical protein
MTTAIANAPARQTDQSAMAYQILRLGFTVAPILFGLDKFLNLMADWTEYLPAFVTDAVNGSVVMAIVGVIEIAAGLGVWFRPRIFATVVAAWLGLIIVTLVIAGGFLDVALRDFGLLLAAVALGRLASAHAA